MTTFILMNYKTLKDSEIFYVKDNDKVYEVEFEKTDFWHEQKIECSCHTKDCAHSEFILELDALGKLPARKE